jgi:hypothetical protein
LLVKEGYSVALWLKGKAGFVYSRLRKKYAPAKPNPVSTFGIFLALSQT